MPIYPILRHSQLELPAANHRPPACRCPSLEATATGNAVLCAALAVCKEWCDYVPAVAAIQLALKAQLHFLGPGAHATYARNAQV